MIADMTAWKESLMGSMRQPKDRSEELWPPLKHCLAWSAISASTTVCVVCLFYYYYIYLSYIFIMYDVIIYIYCECSVVIRSEMLKNWPHRQQLAWRFPCTRRKAVWGAEEPELDYKGRLQIHVQAEDQGLQQHARSNWCQWEGRAGCANHGVSPLFSLHRYRGLPSAPNLCQPFCLNHY